MTVVLTGPSGVPLRRGTAATKPDGTWEVPLRTDLPPGTSYTLTITGTKVVALTDVAVGDVWVRSGQSNMALTLAWLTRDGVGEKAGSTVDPGIRLFTVPNRSYPTPQPDLVPFGSAVRWLPCRPPYLINFSAVAYFFGRDVLASHRVPVGLILTAWGAAWRRRG